MRQQHHKIMNHSRDS